MNIGIIVLNWNGVHDTLNCLDAINALTDTEHKTLFLCDNKSTDGSWSRFLQWAKQHYADTDIDIIDDAAQSHYNKRPCKLIQTGANLGFAGGINVAIRLALQGDFDYLWILNNDTRVMPDALAQLANYARQQPDIDILGATILEDDASESIQCAGGCFYSPTLTIVNNALQGLHVSTVIEQPPALTLDYIFGAAMFCKTSIFRKIGLFQEDYFLFYEELDLTQRLKRIGGRIGWCPAAKIYHQGSASIGKRGEGNRGKLKLAAYYENRNTLKYTARFHRLLLGWVMVFRFCAKSLLYVYRRDFYLLPVLLLAYYDFFRGK